MLPACSLKELVNRKIWLTAILLGAENVKCENENFAER